ncbi:type 1 fimbrial protein [Pseudomonas akapageensis]|uniref:type 1 fimbrial protein n=1 Tax=Pseudomonas akapageensis TaxID=2609961 RepID=UPI00140773F2|nr:type 1 fimbrial protein [Pseudomonas akapageensis]
MINTIRWLCALALGLCFFDAAIAAETGVIHFTGRIVEPPCQVRTHSLQGVGPQQVLQVEMSGCPIQPVASLHDARATHAPAAISMSESQVLIPVPGSVQSKKLLVLTLSYR